MNGRAFLAAPLALGLAATPVPAFTPQPPPARVPTFGSAVSLVRIGVVVRDKTGALVRGLKREDFTITEDGKPQPVEVFDFEEVATERAVAAGEPVEADTSPPAVLATRTIRTPLTPPAGPPADFGGKRLVVLLFDSSGMEPEQVDRAVTSARRYLSDRMTASDLVAVASIGPSGLEVSQDFTADRERLGHALDRIEGYDDSSAADAAAADLAASDDPAAASSFTPDTTELDLFNIDRRLRAIEDLSKALAPIVQKKSVIYFSSGMSGVTADNQVELRAAIDGAVKANLSVYPLDARGLEAVVPGGDARQASRGGSDVFSGQAMTRQFTSAAASQDSLASLASDTGGRTFFDTNDFAGAFDRVISDTSAYYILGYTSANPAKDGRFRRVKVSINRPDLRLEHRSGYYAERDFAHAGKDDRDLQLQDQLFADLSATDFPVWVQADHFRTGSSRFYVPLSVAVPGAALFPADSAAAGASAKGGVSLDLIGVVRDEAKRAVARLRDTVHVDSAAGVRGKNVQYRTGFTLPPGKYRLKIVARENQGGTFGSFESEIVIPDLRRDAVKLSSVVLGTQLEPAKRGTENPLARDGSELLPTVTHVVSARQPLYLYYEAYDPARTTGGGVKLLSSVAFLSGGRRRYETPLVEVTHLSAPDRGAAILQLSVPAASLKPGFYVCQVTVIDDVAGAFSFPRVALLVRP